MKNWLANLLSKLHKKPKETEMILLSADPLNPIKKGTTLEDLLDRVDHDLQILGIQQALEATQPRKDLN